VSNIGTTLSNVGTGWLMTSLTSSVLMVTLVQVATTLPAFVFALPAGALADVLDRRRLLIGSQVLMAIVATGLWLGVSANALSPILLVAASFLMGSIAAFSGPAFQAIVSELVPKSELPSAISVNGIGINIARAVGPAIGGVLIGVAGIASPFFMNAVSFLGVIAVFALWHPIQKRSLLPAEHLTAAVRSGLRFSREAPALRATLIHAASFCFCASGYWALLPLIAKRLLYGDASTYGILLGSIGLGAIGGSFILPKARSRLRPENLVTTASVVTAVTVTGMALTHSTMLCVVLLACAGVAWIMAVSTYNVAAQATLPTWVKARGLAMYQVVFGGAMALGSASWGWLAEQRGITTALIVSAAVLAIAALVLYRVVLPDQDDMDLTQSAHWLDPSVHPDTQIQRGPVMVTVEYYIASSRQAEFATAIEALGRIRRRDGAILWRHFVDITDPSHQIELFMLEDWVQHLRQHERVTIADKQVQDHVNSFQINGLPPKVTHFTSP
jgi:MFS family permease